MPLIAMAANRENRKPEKRVGDSINYLSFSSFLKFKKQH